jgi:hypothetical protein
MFLGALLGTVLIVHADAGPSVLLVAFALLAAVIIVAARSSRSTEAWTARK